MFILICFLTFGFYVASYMRIPVVPIYVKLMGASTKMAGAINSTFFLTAGLLSFPMGFLSDRLGRKLVILGGLALVSLTAFALYFATSPIHVMAIYFLFGIGLSAYGPTMMSFVSDITPVSHAGRAYGWYTMSLYIGMSIGPAIGSWSAERFGYGTLFVSSGILTTVLFSIVILVVPGQTRLRPLEQRTSPNISSFKNTRFLNRALIGSWLITWGGCFALGMFVTFIPLYARDSGLSLSNIGSIFLFQGLTNAIARTPFGWLSDRIGNRERLPVIGIFITAMAILGFAVSYELYQFLINATLLGIGMAIAFPSIGAIIADVSSPSMRGTAMGGYNTSIYLGIMSASLAMGPIIEKWGYKIAFSLSSVITLLTTFTFATLMYFYRKSS